MKLYEANPRLGMLICMLSAAFSLLLFSSIARADVPDKESIVTNVFHNNRATLLIYNETCKLHGQEVDTALMFVWKSHKKGHKKETFYGCIAYTASGLTAFLLNDINNIVTIDLEGIPFEKIMSF